MRRLVASTGYREEVVRYFLKHQRELLKAALVHGESLTFPEVFRVCPQEREMWVRSPSSGRRKVRRVILTVRPTKTFRAELNKWTEGIAMDKFGVVTTSDTKTAGTPSHCPGCGTTDVKLRDGTPWCPNCGTEPWEPKNKEQRDARPKA